MRLNRFISLSGFVLVAGLAAALSVGCEETGGFATDAKQATSDAEVEPRIPPKTHYAAGRLLERRGDFEGAIKQYRRAIALSADYVDALNRLGVTLDRVGRFQEADAAFTEAIILQPGEAYLRNNLAFSYMLQRRWPDAEAELRNALVLDPNFERARVNLALVLARQQRFEDALTAFTLALPEADAHYNMGLIYREQRMFAEAQASFNRSLVLDPSMQAARQQLTELEQRLAAVDTQRQEQQRRLVEQRLAEQRLTEERLARIDATPTIEATSAAQTVSTPNVDEPLHEPTPIVNEPVHEPTLIVEEPADDPIEHEADPACDDELTETLEAIPQTPPQRAMDDPIADRENAMDGSDDGNWTIPVEQPEEPKGLSLGTTLLLNADVHDLARSAVRDVMEFGEQLALAESSRSALSESSELEPIDAPAQELVVQPSVSTDDIPTARIAPEPQPQPHSQPDVIAPTPIVASNPLDDVAAVDGPTAGRVPLFGSETLVVEARATPVRSVSVQRQAALAKYRDAAAAPLAPHRDSSAAGPNDHLPNRPTMALPGSCQCTDRWYDHLLPKE